MKRILGGLLLLCILALPIIFGPVWVFCLIAYIVVLTSLYELTRVFINKDARILGWLVCAGSMPFLWFTCSSDLTSGLYTIAITALAVIICGLILFEKSKANAKEVAFALSELIYPLVLMCFWVLVRCDTDGRFWMIYGLLCTFASDIGAYYFGRSLGRHHLVPKLSPNKTWEGLAGGMLTSIISGTIFALAYMTNISLQAPPDLWIVALAPVAIALLDLTGDLTASMFKREFGVKDMGNLIPGHGGMLDRMDGIIPVGIFVYILMQVIH